MRDLENKGKIFVIMSNSFQAHLSNGVQEQPTLLVTFVTRYGSMSCTSVGGNKGVRKPEVSEIKISGPVVISTKQKNKKL